MQGESFSLATLNQFVGRELGLSDWILMNQQRISELADCTGDQLWARSIDPKAGGRTLFTTENIIEIEHHEKPALIANVLTVAVSA